jgi:hypothetical protein
MPIFDTCEDKNRHRFRAGWVAALIFLTLLTVSLPAHAGVQVFDRVTAVDRPVYLKIRTTGLIFPSGGQRIALQIGGQAPRTLLSGADGFAYLRFQPRQPGLIRLAAAFDSEQAQGILLVLAETQSALLVEVDPALRPTPFSAEAREASPGAIERLQQHYAVVYLVRWPWVDRVRKWLLEAGFPISAVIRWEGRDTARQLKKNGVDISVAVGSSQFLEELPDAVVHRYAFEPNAGEEPVQHWRQILDALLPGDK